VIVIKEKHMDRAKQSAMIVMRENLKRVFPMGLVSMAGRTRISILVI